jgi:hypothetical protein
MGKIPGPTGDYKAGNFALGKYVEDDLTVIVNEFNGNIDSTNIADSQVTTAKIFNGSVDSNSLAPNAVVETKVDYTDDVGNSGVNAWICGPDYSGAQGHRIVRIKKAFTLDGTSPDSVIIFFSQYGVDGYPYFSSVPSLLGEPILEASNANDAITSCRVTSMAQGFVVFEIAYGNGTGDVVLHCAVGGPTWRA